MMWGAIVIAPNQLQSLAVSGETETLVEKVIRVLP
jgi:hypothetical protein